jgi:hypothetical protein
MDAISLLYNLWQRVGNYTGPLLSLVAALIKALKQRGLGLEKF